MKQSSLTHRASFFAHMSLWVLLMIGQTAGFPQYASAQGETVLPMKTGSDSVISGSGLSFEPMSLVAPNCAYGGLIQSITATSQYSVTFELCRPDPAFLVRLAMPPFAIYPQEWIEATSDVTNRTIDGLENPIGTGPYMVSGWDHGNNIIFVKNPDYWGESPQTDMLVFRWSDQPAQSLLELQAGTIDGFDGPAVEDYATINADLEMQLIYRPDQNVFYVGMTNTFLPFDDVRVRQAVAKAIDRQHIVDTFYPAGSEVATHFTPCLIPNGCSGDSWYAYDPTGAKALLTAAGYPSGFPTHLYYRNVSRLYLPQVADIAQEIHNQLLTNLGIDAVIVEMDSSIFLQEVLAGHLNGLHLLGWGVDYPHITNFLDSHFGKSNAQFGNPFPAIFNRLAEGAQYSNPILAAPSYTAANNAIRENVPMVPVAHSSSSVAYLADVTNPQASPQRTDYFASSDPGGRNIFRWMQTYEPGSLFCADEADNNTFRACTQVTETLYRYINNGASTEPALAESCVPATDLTSYTCTLRQGVKFHDGTGFDANDVVETFAMGLDISSPYHKGNSNMWVYYNSIFGLMDTAIHTISGNVGTGNAVLKYIDAGNRTVTANENGDYSFMVSNNWSGTVTPYKTGYTFSPADRTYTNVLSDQISQDYTATIFSDLTNTYWAWQYIERLYNAGITGGCSTNPLNYCPENQVTRAQMAVFLEKGLHYPSSFTAPNVAPTFTDTVGHWAEDWIEALKSDGVTAGCATGLYCPENPVTRAQMAVFLLKSKYGAGYLPPAVGADTGFGDVLTTHWAAAWIKQLAAEGITGGCGGGNYCPENPVTRAQMAVFLVKTFGLP